MQRIDRRVGVALAVLAAAVLWSARAFPNVPGQKLGAGFLPLLIGIGLLLCGLGLVVRSLSAGTGHGAPARAPADEHYGSAVVLVAAIATYLLLADRLGFLIVAPLVLAAAFRSLRVNWLPTVAWAVAGTLVVHLAFYKLLRVPLPWGVLRPFY